MGFEAEAVVTLSAALRQRIDACVAARGATVVDIVARGEARAPVFEIFVDNLEGVTLDLCREINRDLQPLLDADIPGGRYRLEVSSPGLGRPLKYSWQYRKHIGKVVQVDVGKEGAPALRTGRLVALSDDGITIESKPSAAEETIYFNDIVSATIRPPW